MKVTLILAIILMPLIQWLATRIIWQTSIDLANKLGRFPSDWGMGWTLPIALQSSLILFVLSTIVGYICSNAMKWGLMLLLIALWGSNFHHGLLYRPFAYPFFFISGAMVTIIMSGILVPRLKGLLGKLKTKSPIPKPPML